MTRYHVWLTGELYVAATVDAPGDNRPARDVTLVVDDVIERAFTLVPDRLCARCAGRPTRTWLRTLGDVEPVEVLTAEGVTLWHVDDRSTRRWVDASVGPR